MEDNVLKVRSFCLVSRDKALIINEVNLFKHKCLKFDFHGITSTLQWWKQRKKRKEKEKKKKKSEFFFKVRKKT